MRYGGDADTATDYNYYTKRILFNSAYATTELHLLTDQSQSKEESWNSWRGESKIY